MKREFYVLKRKDSELYVMEDIGSPLLQQDDIPITTPDFLKVYKAADSRNAGYWLSTFPNKDEFVICKVECNIEDVK